MDTVVQTLVEEGVVSVDTYSDFDPEVLKPHRLQFDC